VNNGDHPGGVAEKCGGLEGSKLCGRKLQMESQSLADFTSKEDTRPRRSEKRNQKRKQQRELGKKKENTRGKRISIAIKGGEKSLNNGTGGENRFQKRPKTVLRN